MHPSSQKLSHGGDLTSRKSTPRRLHLVEWRSSSDWTEERVYPSSLKDNELRRFDEQSSMMANYRLADDCELGHFDLDGRGKAGCELLRDYYGFRPIVFHRCYRGRRKQPTAIYTSFLWIYGTPPEQCDISALQFLDLRVHDEYLLIESRNFIGASTFWDDHDSDPAALKSWVQDTQYTLPRTRRLRGLDHA